MLEYYIAWAGLCLVGAALCWKKRSRLKDGIFLLVSFTFLSLMSAVRYDIGTDYNYVYTPFYLDFIKNPAIQTRFEPGFLMLCKAISFFSNNYQMLFVVTSVLTIGLIMLFYWLYSPNPFISVFMFIALSQYYCSMNFLRQTLAASIAIYCLPLLRKRNILSIAGYFALTLLAASIHQSALILIPFFFINLIPVNKFVLPVYAMITSIIYFNSNGIVDFITQYWYQQYKGNIHMTSTFEFPFALAVAAVFLLIFLGAKLLLEKNKRNYLYINYAFFTLFFTLMGTRHSILDRLALYFELTAPVAIAIILHALAQKSASIDAQEAVKVFYLPAKAVFATTLALVIGGGLAIHQYALTLDHHDVVPYAYIFNQPPYQRYAEWLKQRDSMDPELWEPDDQVKGVAPSAFSQAEESSAAASSETSHTQAIQDTQGDLPVEVPNDEFTLD